MNKHNATTTLHGDIEEVRAFSIKFFGDWGQSIFIPISVIEDGEVLEVEDNVDIEVTTWWCREKGID